MHFINPTVNTIFNGEIVCVFLLRLGTAAVCPLSIVFSIELEVPNNSNTVVLNLPNAAIL